MTELKPGDVLSFSSGRQDHGPYGFRVIRRGAGVMGLLSRRWPEVLSTFRGRTPIVINAYPAALGAFDFGVMVDSYLSLATASRALHLAALEKLPVMLLGQACFVADLLYRHLVTRAVLPDTLVIGTGGYTMPRSLESAVRALCAQYLETIHIVHGYGVAEVDSSCLLAVNRDESGQLVYFPRDDVRVDLDGEKLLLTLLGADGTPIMERVWGGDSARATADGGYHIWNSERLHPNVGKILESWSARDWERRTGYLYYGREIRFQLRKGYDPELALEAEFHDYMKRYGQQWLFKPEWGRMNDADKAGPMRRTIL